MNRSDQSKSNNVIETNHKIAESKNEIISLLTSVFHSDYELCPRALRIVYAKFHVARKEKCYPISCSIRKRWLRCGPLRDRHSIAMSLLMVGGELGPAPDHWQPACR